MANGTITKWVADKGFGFIKAADGTELFCHVTDCDGFDPAVGLAVTFEKGMGKSGKPAAKQVRSLPGAAHSTAATSITARPVPAPAVMRAAQPPMKTTLQGNSAYLLVPAGIAQIVMPHLSNPIDLHPGLLLDRLPSRTHIDPNFMKDVPDREHQKDHLDRVTTARPWKKEEYASLLTHLVGDNYFQVTARSRIALHLSRAGGLENANCCLHPIHGIAYLPGSGLKGLASAYAGHVWETSIRGTPQDEAYIREVEDIFGWAPNSIRNAQDKRDADPRSAQKGIRDQDQCRGDIVFHDAFGLNDLGEPPNLEVDVLTCHYQDYYMHGKPPGDWQSPNPVTFLTIAANTKFRFRVSAAHSAVPTERIDAAKRLLLGGLYWLGAGAKTASGYGWFDDKCEEPPKNPKIILSELKPEEFLWVRTTGQRQGEKVEIGADGSLSRTGTKIELAQPSPATAPGDVVVVAKNPNPQSTKPIPVRLIPGLKA